MSLPSSSRLRATACATLARLGLLGLVLLAGFGIGETRAARAPALDVTPTQALVDPAP
ncbi:hypothetical protein [Salinarimonas ramus]|uniref:Uncharacterized protein n=1 Tax=Salinarimonas ramus TaxID=690164 RepID=A0A917Q5P1_9HYPH|nr:hypothetical protein [Salinarimonas ramus]GGK18769.1 hypothetical protein GCM10011322_01860 [Salinarimonas ramus]